MRVCSLALVGALGVVSSTVIAQEAVSDASGDLERPGAFELVFESSGAEDGAHPEDVQIFSPLSPVIVEQEPIKLPKDQSLER